MFSKNIWLILSLLFVVSCGGGGGSSGYSSGSTSSSSTSSSSSISNLNPTNACKKAWYTSTPDATSTNTVFNNYSYFWQATSFETMPICLNYYEVTTAITSPWKTYISELLEYSKNTLGQIVPLNVFTLGAIPQSSVTSSEGETFNIDFATVQAPVASYSIENYADNADPFGSRTPGGGYSHEAAPNGADIALYQADIWATQDIDNSLKIIAHEYFHVYQNSIKFYNESTKTINLPKAWFSNPNLINNPTIPAYFPWYIEEGGAEFGGIVLAAKYANSKAGISTNPVQQFKDHFDAAFAYYNPFSTKSLVDFNITGNVGYSAGATALLYLWNKDPRNFNAAMTGYYTAWQEAELIRPSNGWQDAFEDVFWKNTTEYYTLSDFVTEFDAWMTSNDADTLWNSIAKTANEIIHADVIPSTVNTPNSATKTIQVEAAAKVVGSGTGNRYFIDGVQQKTLIVKAGQTYKFSYPSNHPFLFSSTENGTWGPDGIAGTSDDGVVFSSLVTEGTNEITITMPNATPTTLYYYCGAHSNMGGQIIIKEQIAESSSSGGGGSGGGGGSYPY